MTIVVAELKNSRTSLGGYPISLPHSQCQGRIRLVLRIFCQKRKKLHISKYFVDL